MIAFADGALDDLDRIFRFNEAFDAPFAQHQVEIIVAAISVLDQSPYIGRRVRGSQLRELVIAGGKTGYVAKYEYDEHGDLVRVAAIRHQREAGYRSR